MNLGADPIPEPTAANSYIWISLLGDPNQAAGIGALGCVFALFFSNVGAAFGTAKSGCAILEITSIKPELVFKSIIPVVMAGILGMYGLIIGIILKQNSKSFAQLSFQIILLILSVALQSLELERSCTTHRINGNTPGQKRTATWARGSASAFLVCALAWRSVCAATQACAVSSTRTSSLLLFS